MENESGIRLERNQTTEEISFHKIIWEKYLPYALSIGVTYEIFWHLNPRKLVPFSKAHSIRQQERMNDMWYMGIYVASALDATVCNSIPFMKRNKKGMYLDAPIRVIPLTEEEKREEEEKALEQFVNFFNAFKNEANGENKEGE